MDKGFLEKFSINEVIEEYKKSGQRQVYLVDHKDYGKVMFKIVEGDGERIKREVEIVTENNFDYVPKVLKIDDYDFDDKQGVYIIEEYIDGETLNKILSRGKMDLSEGMGLAEGLLNILAQMEGKGVVHRDLKPDNIIKGKDGHWYLIDFGIARALKLESLTMTEVGIGPHTPGYGAPELFQYAKADIDSRADVFSLGVILFEALTGKHPFIRGDEYDVNEIWYKTATVMPQSEVIEGDVDMQFMSLIQTYMQKHITRRPVTAKRALEWYYSVKKAILGGA